MELQLIELYLWVCLVYDKHPMLKYQRLSNNWQPDFTDQELITVYLFGHLQGHYRQKRIHRYIEQHFSDWFPKLPSYQAFNGRLNQLSEAFQVLVYELVADRQERECYFDDFVFETECVMDSMPIMLARASRSVGAKVAREESDQGYCASKQIYYHGVKMHILARKQYRKLPTAEMIQITAASRHDLRVLQELEGKVVGNLFVDKAYQDHSTERAFEKEAVIICTPDKKKKNQETYELGKSGLWSRFVSSIRQPIESLFNWINEQAEIQNGSRIRSRAGLLVHCYGKLAVSLFMLRFNS